MINHNSKYITKALHQYKTLINYNNVQTSR